MMGHRDKLNGLESDAYEAEHPLPPVSDAAMLEHLLNARGITVLNIAADAAGVLVDRICDVLSGGSILDAGEVELLARYFNVKPGVFEDRVVARTLVKPPAEGSHQP